MKLKRLVLQGYKTFATKTEFVFDEGITAVVGPNGSGKSNIADAIRWVLGEQSYSALRGKRTTDMIFAGSHTRARAGMASVILTLDNSDGWLPIDYSEIEIGRRAYRSGENEYILNGQKVRLKDIAELLATSGLAERTYTIIGQGLVDKALSLRAEERRSLFEEAAGISHYKAKRAETLRRLKETERNLERVYDILSEIRPRLTSLKRQATRARNYEQVGADLRHLLRIWYGYQWESTKEEMRLARETAVNIETLWKESRVLLGSQQEKIEAERRQINRLQAEIDQKQRQRDDLRERLEKSRREAAILEERQRSLTRGLAELDEELPAVADQQAAAQEALTAATAELKEAQDAFADNQRQLQQFDASFKSQQAEINQQQENLRRAEQNRRGVQTRLAQAAGQLSQLRERLAERQADAQAGGDGEKAKMETAVSQQTAALVSIQQKRDDLRKRREAAAEQRTLLIRELKKERQTTREQERDLNKQRNQLARQETRLDMLEKMRRRALDDAPPVKNLEIIGQFFALITIPEAYQTAVEAALQARLSMLIVADEQNLARLVEAKGERSFTAVALEALRPPAALADDQVSLLSVVTPQQAIAPAAETLLGGVALADDPLAAYALAKTLPAGAMAVTLDGFVAYAGGVVEQHGRSAADSLLAREAERRQTKEELDRMRRETTALEQTIAAEQKTIQEKQREIDDLQNEERRLGRLEYESAQRVADAERKADRAKQQQEYEARQRAAQAQEAARLAQRIEAAQETIAADEEELVTLETAVSHAQLRLQELPVAEGKQQRAALRQNMSAAQTIVAGRRAVVDSRRAALDQLDRQLARLRRRRQALQEQQSALRLDDERAQIKGLQTELDQLNEALTPLRKDQEERRKRIEEMEEQTAVYQKQAHDRETSHTQTQIALNKRQNQLDSLQERIKTDLGIVDLRYDDDQTGPTPLPMGEMVESLPVVEELPPKIETTIQTYRAQMQRMGSINPDAPEEYEATQERYDFLQEQVEDLTKTEAQMRQIIAELDELTSRAFAETVEKVNAVFGGIFTQLFGGGSARLSLTDPDNLTVSGVDIIARLPNRREQGLGLLSGGERSLTAGALIFSLLKVSPTPFCVMDEVDAALDEANVNRFRDLLRELSLKTQFIIITHNRGTVQTAHTIYGISMGADTASQALSIKPEEYVKQAVLMEE